MDSFSKSSKRCVQGFSILILLSALMIIWSSAHAEPAPSAASPQATASAKPDSSQASENDELLKEIQVGLARIVPIDMRIESVTLGCKPPTGTTLEDGRAGHHQPDLAQLHGRVAIG